MDCGSQPFSANSILEYTTIHALPQWICGLGFVERQGPCQADARGFQSGLCVFRRPVRQLQEISAKFAVIELEFTPSNILRIPITEHSY